MQKKKKEKYKKNILPSNANLLLKKKKEKYQISSPFLISLNV